MFIYSLPVDILFSENIYMNSKLKCLYGQANNAKPDAIYGYKHVLHII